MKRSLLVIILSVIGLWHSSAQETTVVKGTVLDKQYNTPMEWVTVAIVSKDGSILSGVSTDNNGEYCIPAIDGNYTLSVSFLGYSKIDIPISVNPGENIIHPVYMEIDAGTISAATVIGKSKLIERHIDKVVMNISDSHLSQGSDAYELLQMAPGVYLNSDGTVMLNNTPSTILINGRQSFIDGSALTSFLRATNSESIDKIEIMTNPSSKYDAGMGCIINIKIKRSPIKGFSGTLGAGGGGMYFKKVGSMAWDESSFANLSYRGNKISSYLNINTVFGNKPRHMIRAVSNSETDYLLSSNNLMTEFSHDYNMRFGTDLFVNDKNIFGFIFEVPGDYSVIESQSNKVDRYLGGTLLSSQASFVKNGPKHNLQHNFNLNYTHIFDESRSSELTTNIDYYHNTSSKSEFQADTLYSDSALPAMIYDNMTLANISDVYSAKVDYQTDLWEHSTFETGAKWTISNVNYNSCESHTGISDEVSVFDYSEHVAALYASLTGKLGAKLSYKAGLRSEYTNSYGDWQSSSITTSKNFINIFPTAYLQYELSNRWALRASYSRFIQRPSYSQYNPSKVFYDISTYSVGNPDILPAYNTESNISATYNQYLTIMVYCDHIKNLTEKVSTYDSDGIQYLLWRNNGKELYGGLSLSITSLPITDFLKWSCYYDGIAVRAESISSGIVRKSVGLRSFNNLTVYLPSDWIIGVRFVYNTPTISGSKKVLTRTYTDATLAKSLLDGRMNLTVNMNDIFATNNLTEILLDETLSGATSTMQKLYYKRRVKVSLNWKFGQSRKASKSRKVSALDEASRTHENSGE